MIRGIIMTHGHVGEELITAAEAIGGPISELIAVPLLFEDSQLSYEEKVRKVLTEENGIDEKESYVFLTDIFGGTPCNVALSLMRSYNSCVVTGVNLAMILEFALDREEKDDWKALGNQLAETVKKTTQVIENANISDLKEDEEEL